jgi:hypothetical protein
LSDRPSVLNRSRDNPGGDYKDGSSHLTSSKHLQLDGINPQAYGPNPLLEDITMANFFDLDNLIRIVLPLWNASLDGCKEILSHWWALYDDADDKSQY